jgi:hypothetical protein
MAIYLASLNGYYMYVLDCTYDTVEIFKIPNKMEHRTDVTT